MTYITKRYLDDLSSHLSDRDITIIGAVSELRWASGRQLQRLFFTEGIGADSSQALPPYPRAPDPSAPARPS
jgi:hypothetical protein